MGDIGYPISHPNGYWSLNISHIHFGHCIFNSRNNRESQTLTYGQPAVDTHVYHSLILGCEGVYRPEETLHEALTIKLIENKKDMYISVTIGATPDKILESFEGWLSISKPN